MYEAFYGLKERPFTILPDPDYLYLGHRHSLAYAMLQYGIEQGAGFTVITGEIGCGKTTLIRHLLNHLHHEVLAGLISNTVIKSDELLKWVLLAFDQSYQGTSQIELHDRLTRFLIGQYSEGHRTVLIVDEAQNLGIRALEELRMLSNINADKDQLLHLVLVGQPQLRQLLRQPELAQLAQRVASDFHIPPLSTNEVGEYIRHRLSVAGRTEPLFEDDAIDTIAHASEGKPRKINVLCDTALVYGFADGASQITGELIKILLAEKKEYGVLAL